MLQLQNIGKSFPGVKALSGVSLTIRRGEVHAIVGENGAGKSTLMNILAGNLQADEGNIFIDDQQTFFRNATQARSSGISIVYQERSLVETLNVAENIFPANHPKTFWGTIDYPQLHRSAKALLHRLQIDISTHAVVDTLSPPQKQMVEIAKALASPSRLLLLDEPTASITHRETETLFNIIRELKKQGVAIIYITHRMNEIQQIADVVSILKDGKLQGTVDAQRTSIHEIIRLMVGRELQTIYRQRHTSGDVVFEVRNISGNNFNSISFKIHKGEILGFAGLVGSGRTEIAKAIFGDELIITGEIYKNEALLKVRKPADAIRKGITYVPEERIKQGIFPGMTVEENMMVASQRGVWTDKRLNRARAEEYVKLLSIRTPSVGQKIDKLSGGNQQKVVLSRWLTLNPDVLMVDEPTHGVDVGSKFEIYELIKNLAAQGMGILLISSELPELLMLADRIAIMYKGELKKILNREETTEEAIMHWASGHGNIKTESL